MCRNRIFLPVTLLLSLGFVSGVSAVPAVKVLGQKSANVTAADKGTVKKASSSQLSRAASVRNTGVSVKPVSVSKNTSKATPTKAVAAPQRLSIGKYIHGAGVNSGLVKPVTSVGNTGTASSDIVSLLDRILALETTVLKKGELQAGDGIEIEDETISVSNDFKDLPTRLAELSGKVAVLQQAVDEMSTENRGVVDTFVAEDVFGQLNN